jgi:hypothetical protein
MMIKPTLPPLTPQVLSLVALMGLLPPRLARAEDSLTYKYQDYREADGRIAVQVQSALVEKDLGLAMHLKVTAVMDSIAGATPDGQPAATPGGPVPVSQMEEERKAWGVDFSRQFARINVTAGVANSRESDYVSHGWSLNTLTDFNEKNTTLVLGVAGTDDDIKVYFQRPQTHKRGLDVLVGVNQLLDPLTAVTFNLTYSQSDGYLGDPYKLVQRQVEVFPGLFLPRTSSENRPDHRTKWIAFAGINRALPRANGALEASYRYNWDDFGIESHTLSLAWYQKLGARFMLVPTVRAYRQSAAHFYYVSLTGTGIVPIVPPTGRAPYYSSDHRLSALDTLDYGLKVIWTVTSRWQIDAAYDRYEMQGRDGITSGRAYPQAAYATCGLKFTF